MDISHVCLFAQDTDTRSRWNLPRQCVAICTMEPNSNAIWCTDDTCILGMHASAYVYSRLKRIANRMLYPNRAIQWHAIFSAQGKSSSDRQSEAELKKSKGAPGGAGSKAAKSLFFPSASWGSVDFCKGALLLPSFLPSLPFPSRSFPFLSFPFLPSLAAITPVFLLHCGVIAGHHIASSGCCGAHLDPNGRKNARQNVRIDARQNVRKNFAIECQKVCQIDVR